VTIEEACAHIGRSVVYRGHPGAEPEQGLITGVGQLYVFVRYGTDEWTKATPPERLEFEVAS